MQSKQSNWTFFLRFNRKISKKIDRSIKILIDESFIEFVDERKHPRTFIEKINEFQNVVVLRSLTKSFGLAGLRLGYCVSHPSIGKKYRTIR